MVDRPRGRVGREEPHAQGAVTCSEEVPSQGDVIALGDPRALDPELAGAKAAALARAATQGLSVLPGFVITTVAVQRLDGGAGASELADDLRAPWRELGGARQGLVVRSSSPLEDLARGSMAGRYESVVGVHGWDDFLAAVDRVVASRVAAAVGTELAPDHPIAVLVQPVLDARMGGVLFGVDPVTGRSDRLVVAAVAGGPEKLVSGAVDGSRLLLDRVGGLVEHTGDAEPSIGRRDRRRLARLAADAARVFGAPQDVEWAVDREGRLVLLQSRPVTTPVTGVPSGPVLDPGPVSETFPDPLSPLEEELWVEPLREALRVALPLAGVAPRRVLEASPVAVSVGGRIALDVAITGERHRGARAAISRRVRALPHAWRVGRLRGALPAIAGDLVRRVDRELLAVPAPAELTDAQLAATLGTLRTALTSVHGHEILLGQLLRGTGPAPTAADLALRSLAEARAAGLDDETAVQAHPGLLSLLAPRIGGRPDLPQVAAPARPEPTEGGAPPPDPTAVLREALRLRVRWLQELGARCAWELGGRLHRAGRIDAADDVRRLPYRTLCRAVVDPQLVLRDHLVDDPVDPGPLPARFQVSDTGAPIPLTASSTTDHGTGAGGGSGRGAVSHDEHAPPEGAVLVVRTLHPGLAPVVGRLGGLVVETGSVLAHTAILAREAGVATVVGFAGAVERFAEGTVVTVDGTAGTVTAVDDEVAP